MDDELLYAILILVKAAQDPQWDLHNEPIVAAARAIVDRRTDEAITLMQDRI